MRSLTNTERVLTNPAVDRLMEKEKALGEKLTFSDIVDEVAGVYPTIMMDGDMDAGAWSCGMVAGLVYDIPSVKELIVRLMSEAEEIIQSNELLSHNLLKAELFPELNNQTYFLIVIDNLRYDQWLMLKPIVENLYSIESEGIYSSIIPTTTQYARNALFAGLSPLEISKRYAHKWVTEEENEGKNLHEDFFFNENLRRNHLNLKSSYHKITNLNAGKRLVQQIDNLKNNDINTIVYNFVDTLSHARTDMEVIKELAEDESAYRSITLSWFKHSPLFDILKKISNTSSKVFLTTDHGTVRVKNPSKVVGPKNTNSNMRYKVSKNLTYQSKDVIEALHPERINLPKSNISSSYIFAKEDNFFVYPNNYNHFAKLYNDTFQHGGISMEEMLIPYVKLTRK